MIIEKVWRCVEIASVIKQCLSNIF